MYSKNYSADEASAVQNQFSAYLKKAVHRRRIRYLMKEQQKQNNEISQMELEKYLSDDTDFFQELADYEAVQHALRSIKEKERRIVLARIVEEKDFDEIAMELGMSYKAVTSLYYRVLKKLRQHMEGGGKR